MSNTITSLASTLTQSVNEVQKGIVETQAQLASGKATLNAAETGVVSRMTAQVSGYGSVTKNLTDAGSAIDVAQSALTSISEIMSQLKGLATQASSAGFASTDRDSLNLTFQNLTNQIQQLVTSASVNGANLLNTDFGLQITTGIDGTPDSQTQVNATNVGELVTALKQLLITGMQITDQTFAATNLTTPVVTLVGSAIGNVAAIVSSSQTTPVITLPLTGLKAGDSCAITIGLPTPVTVTLTLTSDMSGPELATAFKNYIQSGTQITSGTFVSTTGSGTVVAYPSLTTSVGTGSNTHVITVTATGGNSDTSITYTNSNASPAVTQTQTITLPTTSMAQGNSLTIGNLTFTAGPGPGTSAAGISPSQVSAAFANYINNGVQPDPSIGTFTTTTSAVAQVQTITFRDLAIGDSFSAGGLTFTATATTTAAQLSTAFLAKIGNSASLSQYGTWSGSKVGGLGAAVSAGGSTTSIAWSYSAAGGQLTNLLTTGTTSTGLASYTLSGQSAVAVPSTITKIGMNANTGTKITGGSAYGVSATVTSSNTFSLTTIDPLTTGSAPGGIALLSQNSNTTTRNTLTFTNTNLLAGTANLFPGDSVTINGLTFTASQTTTPQQVLDAFKNVINSGDTGNLYGTFANTDVGGGSLTGKVSEFTNYFTAIDLGNNVLAIDNKDGNTSTVPPEIKWNTQNAAIANANKATQVITGQIDTVSTAQASLAAATAGIQAQLKNATNIKNGMQKTIDAIANIDPTALQANLQQLNTQQSVDYYLVSQMNTAAAAILSIFR
ncbi:flagellin [Polynucleobacter sp. AP-Sanab-80-C2]|uniref:flagellin n=1 Tax=Polynucleobacter sp. AP-Sanab-80-C2 TaxID=3108274 RepID=UPI002B23EC7C|nr:flagellin [Polynucleobacter sp. AP-Sanab-80-C2]MEA9599086.1 flagellin [Polynucleobacter sp. AP-Sanab-80-C2]